MFNQVFEAFSSDSDKWKSMTTWQRFAFVINYLAAVFIIVAAVFPETVNRFMYTYITSKLGTNAVFQITISLAVLIIIMNTSNIVSYEELITMAPIE